MQIKRMLTCFSLLLCISCSVNKRNDFGAFGCNGRKCRGSGHLEVAPGGYGGGAIKTSSTCHDLALPQEIIKNYKKWNGRRVVVTGESFSRPSSPDFSWYDIKDRRIESGGCGKITVYVQSIEFAR